MKPLLLRLLAATSCFVCSNCAKIAGNSQTGEYSATFVMSDVKLYAQTSKKAVIGDMNQSRVPISAIRAATTLGSASILAGVQEGFNNNQTAEVIGAQKAGVAKEAIKSQTTLGLGAQGVEKTRILNPHE